MMSNPTTISYLKQQQKKEEEKEENNEHEDDLILPTPKIRSSKTLWHYIDNYTVLVGFST